MSKRMAGPLYDEVLELVTRIAQPDAARSEDVDETVAADALKELRALYESREASGAPEPFLTEALADFTDDMEESIRLYELALSQCAGFPDEPKASKHIGLARRLQEMGRTVEARAQLTMARQAAFVDRDATAVRELDELEKQFVR